MTEKLIRNEHEAIDVLKKNKPKSGYYMLQESVEMAIQALEKVQAFEAIGTIEEFKALKEKNEPKKPLDGGEVLRELCPTCGRFVSEMNSPYYCPCGQKLDWSKQDSSGMSELIKSQEAINAVAKNSSFGHSSGAVFTLEQLATITEKEIRAKVVEEFAERLHELCGFEIDGIQYPYLLDESRIDEIAEQMKGGAE